MYQFFQDTPEADFRGIRILEDVVRQDPTSALAQAGVALATQTSFTRRLPHLSRNRT